MDAMDSVHCCPGIPITISASSVFDNYITKLQARIGNKDCYPFEDTVEVVNGLGSYIQRYTTSPRFSIVSVVHGDPWFSNTMLQGTSRIVFLDMKGDIAGTLTTNGDPLTDFGKLYQSLLGFDGLLSGDPTPDSLLAPLRTAFLDLVVERGFLLPDLDAITACLIAKTLHFMEVSLDVRGKIWGIVRDLASKARAAEPKPCSA